MKEFKEIKKFEVVLKCKNKSLTQESSLLNDEDEVDHGLLFRRGMSRKVKLNKV